MKCGPEECPIVTFSDLTPAEQREARKRKAQIMSEQGFTEAQIAKQFGVSQQTISSDLANLPETSKSKPAKTESNPKGAGRPKGSKPKTIAESSPILDRARKLVAPLVNAGETVNARKIGTKHGISHVTVETAVAAERAANEARADPTITPDMLSMTAQQKNEAWRRQEMRRLAEQFNKQVFDEVRRRIDEIILPDWKEKVEQAKTLYERRRGLMNKDTFNTIRRALHPDSRNSISDQKLAQAFDAFMALEKYLLKEEDSPTDFGTLPKSMAEWDALKQKVSAERRAKRNGINIARR